MKGDDAWASKVGTYKELECYVFMTLGIKSLRRLYEAIFI